MRSLLFATVAGFGLALAGPAMAQHAPQAMHGGHWHGGGQWHGSGGWHGGEHRHHRDWGGSIGGRWIGGARAPGGWSAYRRPVKGWALPGYWLAPSFTIIDWGDYGLATPPEGWRWSRYYDDAVLVDQYGRVMECVDGLDWDGGYPGDYVDNGDYGYDYSHDAGPGPGAPYPPPPPPRVVTRTYGYDGGPPPPPPHVVVTEGPGCGCNYGGYYYPPVTTTTVTITSVPVTHTTRTVEYIEERAPVVHHRAVHVWHAPHRPSKLVRRKPSKLVPRK